MYRLIKICYYICGDIMLISETIKKIRKDKNISQKELALNSNISTSSIQQIEYGKLKPKLETLIKIFESLNVNYSIFSNKIGFQNANFNKTQDIIGYFYDYDSDNVTIKNIDKEQQKLLNGLVEEITTPNFMNGTSIRDLVVEFDNKESTLLSNFNSVNEDGQQKIVDYSSDIADNPKYKKDK